MTKLQNSKSNFLLAMSLFGVVAVGGVAMMLSSNSAVRYKAGASNVDQSLSQILVKKGTSAFSPCKKLDSQYTYALLGGAKKEKGSPYPKTSGSPDTLPNSCTALIVDSSLAEPLVGKRVSVTGTLTDGVFYATNIVDASNPKGAGKPSMLPARPGKTTNPIMTLEPQPLY